jgi:hypothetical protein
MGWNGMMSNCEFETICRKPPHKTLDTIIVSAKWRKYGYVDVIPTLVKVLIS